jgi:hypothetical protein
MSDAYTDADGKVESTDNTAAVQCPHCVAAGEEEWKTWIEVDRKDFNCKIFRHGIYRLPYEKHGIMVPIPPHAPKQLCDELVKKGMIIGCGKPYKVVTKQEGGGVIVGTEMCGYI